MLNIGKYFNTRMDGFTYLVNRILQNTPPTFTWEFDTEEDFIHALRFFGYSDEKARKSLKHEREHIAKSRDLGYTAVNLGINIWDHPIFDRVVGPFARIEGLKDLEDKIKILQNAAILSPGDFEDLKDELEELSTN